MKSKVILYRGEVLILFQGIFLKGLTHNRVSVFQLYCPFIRGESTCNDEDWDVNCGVSTRLIKGKTLSNKICLKKATD